jgi:hypothetical protein
MSNVKDHPKPRAPTTSAQRMRAKRKRDALQKAREKALVGISENLVEAKILQTWNCDDLESIQTAVRQALEKLADVTRKNRAC